MKTTIWVYTKSGGDGSVLPLFFDRKELCEFEESHDDEGFCDSISSLELESESPITSSRVYSPLPYFFRRFRFEIFQGNEERDEYIQRFFPNGVEGEFRVEVEPVSNNDNYKDNLVFLDDVFIAEVFSKNHESGEALLGQIQKLLGVRK